MPAGKRRVHLGPIGEHTKNNIRHLRLSNRLTQAELADLSGLPAQAITEIENGARRITVDDLAAISKALDVTPEELMHNG